MISSRWRRPLRFVPNITDFYSLCHFVTLAASSVIGKTFTHIRRKKTRTCFPCMFMIQRQFFSSSPFLGSNGAAALRLLPAGSANLENVQGSYGRSFCSPSKAHRLMACLRSALCADVWLRLMSAAVSDRWGQVRSIPSPGWRRAQQSAADPVRRRQVQSIHRVARTITEPGPLQWCAVPGKACRRLFESVAGGGTEAQRLWISQIRT